MMWPVVSAGASCPLGEDGERAAQCSPDDDSAMSPELEDEFLDPWLGQEASWPGEPTGPSTESPSLGVSSSSQVDDQEQAEKGEGMTEQSGPRIHVTRAGLPYPPPVGPPAPYPPPIGSDRRYADPIGGSMAEKAVVPPVISSDEDRFESGMQGQEVD